MNIEQWNKRRNWLPAFFVLSLPFCNSMPSFPFLSPYPLGKTSNRNVLEDESTKLNI